MRVNRGTFDRRGHAVYRGASLVGPARMSTSENKGLGGLEKSLEELEALVTRMESGDLPLEQALKEFERGVKLLPGAFSSP